MIKTKWYIENENIEIEETSFRVHFNNGKLLSFLFEIVIGFGSF